MASPSAQPSRKEAALYCIYNSWQALPSSHRRHDHIASRELQCAASVSSGAQRAAALFGAGPARGVLWSRTSSRPA